jgi:molybdopterin-guanine dinucleotide biosynthesis protein A
MALEPESGVVGVILAGGAGRRLGGGKPSRTLAGRPLLHHPLATLVGLGGRLELLAVVAKLDTTLPALPAGVECWRERLPARHPLAGVAESLRRAGGRSVLAVAGDLPFVNGTELEALLQGGKGTDLAIVPRAGDHLQPLCAWWSAAALPAVERELQAIVRGERRSMTQIALALPARVLDRPDLGAYEGVNTPEDLARAERRLASR